jgi:uncharacterized protein
MPREPDYEVVLTGDVDPGDTLVVGTAGVGVAGLTAADYLVSHVETTQVGHVATRNLPDITPFSNGRPRHPIRLYSTDDSDFTVLISEVFVPDWAADVLADALEEWTTASAIEEVTVLYGAPFPHSESEHVVFQVSTDAYRERHFPAEDPAIDPLAGGFFDGLVGELLVRAMDGRMPPTGVLITPTHLPGPDLNAAVRLLDALEPVYGLAVDESELRQRAEEMERYYTELNERLQALQESAQGQDGREYAGDRMFM